MIKTGRHGLTVKHLKRNPFQMDMGTPLTRSESYCSLDLGARIEQFTKQGATLQTQLERGYEHILLTMIFLVDYVLVV